MTDDGDFEHPFRFPLNASGPFYTTGHLSPDESGATTTTWCGDCLWCGAPEAEAPELMAPFDETYSDTYFVRQPRTPEEIGHAINAALVCCTEAVRYGGRDRAIIERLGNQPTYCDFVVGEDGELHETIDGNGEFTPFAIRLERRRTKKWWQFWR